MKSTTKTVLALALCTAALLSFFFFVSADMMPVLTPKGLIGEQEKSLLITATWLMLIVVLPTIALMIFVVWRYRIGNPKAKYDPNWDKSHIAETIWWGIPFLIVIILSVITWIGCVKLDPYAPLKNEKAPLRVQVVALQWKWLFIYPDRGIASLNFLEIPEKTPVNFEITADAPMNSFWIPKLGGQIYAMPGMNTKLHLIANEEGVFRGSSANLSGNGFASMNFKVKSVSEEEFESWANQAKSSDVLTREAYRELAAPSQGNPETVYRLSDDGLYEWIVMKYMMPEK